MNNPLVSGCMSATFVGRSPTFRKLDRQASHDVAMKNGVSDSVGRYWKHALQCDELDKVRAITAAMRNKFYDATLSWGREGVRIMTAKMYATKYAQSFRDDYTVWEAAVDKFVRAYPFLVIEAQRTLKGMYNQADYPPYTAIRHLFEVSLHIGPVPSVGDFRVELVQKEMDSLKAKLEADLEEVSKEATRDLWSRMHSRVAAMAETFADPEKRFHDTMITHTKELCADLKLLNFADDPVIEAMRGEIETSLANLIPDKVRISSDSDGPRAKAARSAAEIMRKIENMRPV